MENKSSVCCRWSQIIPPIHLYGNIREKPPTTGRDWCEEKGVRYASGVVVVFPLRLPLFNIPIIYVRSNWTWYRERNFSLANDTFETTGVFENTRCVSLYTQRSYVRVQIRKELFNLTSHLNEGTPGRYHAFKIHLPYDDLRNSSPAKL